MFSNLASCYAMVEATTSKTDGDVVAGLLAGAGSGLVPMYLTEIAPVNIRGAMGIAHQFALTCGILLSNVFGIRQLLGMHNCSW